MKNLISMCLVLTAVMAGCEKKTSPLQKTYLYCPVDTLRQSLPAYQITSNTLFPYGTLAPNEKMTDAEWRDGMAVIELEIDRPTTVMVMPVRDSTVAMAWGGNFLLLPGDSLELLTVPDTTFASMKCVRPRLVESTRQDNLCAELMDKSFPYKDRPQVTDGDLVRYKSDLAAFYQRKRDFLDSCRMQMTLSSQYLERSEALFVINHYNDLCQAVEKHPESEAPADYLGDPVIAETTVGSSSYVAALVNKYMKHAVAEPLKHFDEVYAGIRKAPRSQRDYLTALLIGYYAGQEQTQYKERLEEVIADARRTIADTVYLNYIDRAAKFYEKCGLPLPVEVTGTLLRPYGSEAALPLAELLAELEGQAVYLDFWSSWCTGCIMDIMQSAEAKEYLSQAGVVYVCLSLDEDADAWMQAAKKYDVVRHSYLVTGTPDAPLEPFDAPICTFFEIKSIPRYILLDRQHRIVSSDAPRPVSYQMADLKRLVAGMQ